MIARWLLAISLVAPLAPLSTRAAPLLGAVDWVRRPGAEDIARVYPAQAAKEGLIGQAIIGCHVAPSGVLEACAVVREEPAQAGFGDAALRLARYFQVRPAGASGNDPTRQGVPAEGGEIQIPMRFAPPAK
jgi:periplasmic protein TonB